MATFVTFPALLPVFQNEWQLSNTEAGWISGVFFAGFVVSTLILTALTDRLDPKRIFLAGLVITAISSTGFGMFADGVWSATFWRILHGIGYGACYMPGMKALSDAVSEASRDRSVSLFSAFIPLVLVFRSLYLALWHQPLTGRLPTFYLVLALCWDLFWLHLHYPAHLSVPCRG